MLARQVPYQPLGQLRCWVREFHWASRFGLLPHPLRSAPKSSSTPINTLPVWQKKNKRMKKLWLFITHDFHLGARLGLSFGALIVILLSVGGIGIRQLRRVERSEERRVGKES